MTRTVRDAALLLQAMAGPDPRDPLSIDAPPPDFLAACDGDLKGMRVGWSPDLGFAAVDPEVAEITARAARRFGDLGCGVEDAKIDWGNPYEFHRIIYSVNVAARNHCVPCGFTRERLPVGLQIVGRWHRETDVFRAAACFEALQPWAGARPPLD